MLTKRKYTLKNPPHCSGDFYLRSLLVVVVIFCSLSGHSQAKVEIPEWKKSFGTVKKGDQVKLDYEIRNAGNQPLLISESEVACSCTTVDYPQQPILPGQSATVTVTFNTKTVYERQDRIVYLHSNDPHSPAKVRFKGFVQKD